jgi:hypothetical protein
MSDTGHWLGIPDDFILDESWAGFIYLIKNNVTQQKYIGRKYFWMHGHVNKESNWKIYKSSSGHVKEQIKNFGLENFTFEVLSIHHTRAQVNFEEVSQQFKHDVLSAKLPSGEPAFLNRSILGKYFAGVTKHSLKTRAKISASHLGKKKPPLSIETRAKISASQKGKKMPQRTEEHSKNLGLSHRGNKLSIEHKSKISRSNKGKIISKETRNKISNALKGKIKSKETRDKISNALKGKKITFSKSHCLALSLCQNNQTREKCIHCGRNLTKRSLTRWHGNKCSHKIRDNS